MTIKQLQNKVYEEVRHHYDKIINAERNEEMMYYYYGAHNIMLFALNCGIIDLETEKYYDAKIDQAHDKYYEKAKSELESAHKKLF